MPHFMFIKSMDVYGVIYKRIVKFLSMYSPFMLLRPSPSSMDNRFTEVFGYLNWHKERLKFWWHGHSMSSSYSIHYSILPIHIIIRYDIIIHRDRLTDWLTGFSDGSTYGAEDLIQILNIQPRKDVIMKHIAVITKWGSRLTINPANSRLNYYAQKSLCKCS